MPYPMCDDSLGVYHGYMEYIIGTSLAYSSLHEFKNKPQLAFLSEQPWKKYISMLRPEQFLDM